MASDIEITIDQSDAQWVASVFGTKRLLQVIKDGMVQGLLIVHQDLPPYPPEAQSIQYASRISTHKQYVIHRAPYRRTGTLGKSITERAEIVGDHVEGRIGTNVSVQTVSSGYASYVIGGEGEQAWMNVGRWWRLGDEAQKHTDAISGAIGDAIIDFIKNGGA